MRVKPETCSAEEVSRGFTIVDTPLRKAVVIGGLAPAVIVVPLLGLHGGR